MSTCSIDSPKAIKRPHIILDEMDYLPTGKKARLHRLMYQFGPGKGTMMFLPIDQGLEHGPVNFFENPPSKDPNFQCKLARDGGYSAVVFQYGIAEKYMNNYAGQVPLVVKLNGKTSIPSDAAAFSSLIGSVEDAVRLGADAIGYTLYVGSPNQDVDFAQFSEVRKECDRLGMPIIVWAYPRGEAVEAKGGKDSFFAIDYAARAAAELGADVVKVNIPKEVEPNQDQQPGIYKTLKLTQEEKIQNIIASAGKTLTIFSGGAKVSDAETVGQAKMVMENGAAGLIFGRNMWLRPMDEALKISQEISTMMQTVVS